MVDKELIENWRNMVKLPISSLLLKTNYEGMGEQDKEEFERDFDEILNLALIGLKHKAQLSQEGTTKDATSDTISRQFEEIVVRYLPDDLCNYPEYKGKPYFSIHYKENGKDHIGFGTYKPEALSQYLRDYFMPPAQPHLITEIQNGIKVTDADDAYSCGMRNGMRWCMSLIDGKEPLYENCPSAQPEERNWEKGLPEYCYIDSAIRHYLKWMDGQDDEPHDRAVLWNLMCLWWTHENITTADKGDET